MAKSLAAQIKYEAANNVNFKLHPDKIIAHKGGTVELRRGFFYTHGCTAEMWANSVVLNCAACDINVELVTQHENWNEWPKDSYFSATVKAA